MAVPFLACMAVVAATYALPPRVLPAIQAVEGGAVGTVRHDTDGTSDLGVMQINTVWVPTLARLARMSSAATQSRLVSDPCFNIAAAGIVMRLMLNQSGGDVMQAVGDYHSHTPALNRSYRGAVLDAATRLFPR